MATPIRSERAVPLNPESRTRAEPEPTEDIPESRRAARECDRLLEASPTTFGKLVTLAGLQIKGSGSYSHPKLDAMFPTAVVTGVVAKRHQTLFAGWLNLSLEEQHKDLTEFFNTMWTQGTPRLPLAVRQALVPETARAAERALFLTDLECMLSVMESG
jgi:hypothetical protein